MTRLLLVRLSAMGDLVQSLGAVAALRAVRDDVELTFVTQRPWAPLLDGVPGIARVVTFDRGGGLGGVVRLRRALREHRFDAALDLQGNWKSAFVARLSGARELVGMAGPWRQEPASAVLLRHRVRCDAPPHPARAAWELVKQVAPEAPFSLPRLAATPDELDRERDAVRALGVDPARPFRVVVVTDPADPRALRPDVVAALAVDEPPALLLFGPAEARLDPGAGRALRHGAGEVRRLVALGALVAAAGGEVVGPDQGATHVLLAAGARGRVAFGSQDPHRTAPPSATALWAPHDVPCRPCRARTCAHPDGPVCMRFAPDEGRALAPTLPPEGAVGAGPWPARG